MTNRSEDDGQAILRVEDEYSLVPLVPRHL